MLTTEHLESTKKPTLLDLCRREHPEWEKLQEIFENKANYISYDFSIRSAIHDCLDFDQIDVVAEYRSLLLDILFETQETSNFQNHILMGLFGLVLES